VGTNFGTISNSSAHAHVENTWAWSITGGLVGLNTGDVVRSTSSGTVAGGYHLGGLAGENSGIIYACYSKSQATGNREIGALVGWNWQNGLLSNCYSLALTTGEYSVGGLVGHNEGTVTRCYEAGKVSGSSRVGGFIGYQDSITSIDGFWDKTLNPDKKSIGNYPDTSFPEVIGLSTVEMKSHFTFTNAGWDFVGEVVNGPNDVWTIKDGNDYPKLVWSIVDFISFDGVNFADYAHLGRYWKNNNCRDTNDCDGSDIDFSGAVDYKDIAILFNYWLE
jgi:hypothetical protein